MSLESCGAAFSFFSGWTPLHKAASGGFDDVIRELLKAGANVNCENINGIVPLHGASKGNHIKVMVLVKLDFCFLRKMSENMKIFKVRTKVIAYTNKWF